MILEVTRPGAALALTLTCALAGTPASAAPPALTSAQRTVLIEATRQYRDVKAALDAGYLATDLCVPGMGYHYVHPALSAGIIIDPVLPEVLLYDRSQKLLGIEYFKADADGDLGTDTDRPTLFGHRFDGPMHGHEVPAGAPMMPVHYDLHVWLYTKNPAGELATTNPKVTCP
ncbi:hypothetical protein [Actinoplanes sp. G11-F43]|uniref:hypothetical protein n=1 Tax=Actinoplanes sp. G11-F43 TaxID=3424130 RepID=UPI003D3313FB